ncbi:hypothetical protein BANRA_00063 [Escherichia coli]|nr:hypothetical protein BANRA_00063 [Escherichia coli]
MYLVVFNDIPSQRKYLESHGITTIIINDEKYKPFNKDTYSNKLFTFLRSLNSFELSHNLNDIEIIDAVYSKVKSLQSLNAILADQVKDALLIVVYYILRTVDRRLCYTSIIKK